MATSGTTVHGRQGARSVTGGHRAKSTKDWHQACGIKLFAGWPGNSPDLNPIENFVPDKASAKKRMRDVKGGNQERCVQSLEGYVSPQNTSIQFMNPCPEEWPQ